MIRIKSNTLEPTENDTNNASFPLPLLLLLSFQHVVILFCGIIIVSVMLIKIYHFPAAEGFRVLFITTLFAALGTAFQVVRFKRFGLGRHIFMGTSGPFLACAHMAIVFGGPALLSNLVFMSAPFQFLFSYCLRFFRHILTPTVGGVITMLAVSGLLKDSILTWCEKPHITGQAAFIDIAIGAVIIAGMVFSEWILEKKFRHWSLVLGLLLGSFLALVLGQVDLSPMDSIKFFSMPDKLWVGFVFKFDLHHWMLYLSFIMAVFVSSIKYSGDVMALQKVEDPQTRKVDYDGLQGGLYANALTATLSGLAGGLPSTSHAPNIPVMEMTGVVSKRVAITGSLMLVILAFSPKASMALLCIPAPVLWLWGLSL